MGVDFDSQASSWHSDEPRVLSDIVGRPEVLEILMEIGCQDAIVLDEGCGEGYFSRQMVGIADTVIGIDISEEMIRLAKKQEQDKRLGIAYYVGDVRNMPFRQDSIDVCVGNYVANYIHPDELPKFYTEMARVLRPNGRFVLMIPHPVFELDKELGKGKYYDADDFHYSRSRGKLFTARLLNLQGKPIEVGLYHSTLNDHFGGIFRAGFAITKMEELEFPESIGREYPDFKDMVGTVACLILAGQKLD
jgi:SAM-dependent methyltransferase